MFVASTPKIAGIYMKNSKCNISFFPQEAVTLLNEK